MCCVLIAVLQLWLKESDEYEQLMGRTADPRLEKVLALIDEGVPLRRRSIVMATL